jgi:predicted anti-sigma-YlaC factor YlaD
MLRCRDVTGRISDYIDGNLTWRESVAVRLHLAMCRFCRRYLRQIRSTVAVLRTLGGMPASSGERDISDAGDT